MTNGKVSEAVDKAKAYYDSQDADEFYFHVWGGEDIHIGCYEAPEESIFDASRRSVARMASKLSPFPKGSRMIDVGAGYGGSARYVARELGYEVTCLNLSEAQNRRNRQMNLEQGLDSLIDVVDGSFESLPFEDASFEMAWCQDSILHSSNRELVFREIDRVLKPGGEFVMTDPMQRPGADPEALKPVLERIHLPSLGDVETYRQRAKTLNWETVSFEELSEQLVNHYTAVLRTLEERDEELAAVCSQEYRDRMKAGLRRWIEAGTAGALTWGIFLFRKPK